MRKLVLICITFVLLLCFFFLDCSTPSQECSATIQIYNELDSDLFITIDDERKAIPRWGSCKELNSENTHEIVACDTIWDLKWPKPASISHTQEEEEETEPECEEKTYSIVLEGVYGLDRSITVNNYDSIKLTVYKGGWKLHDDSM